MAPWIHAIIAGIAVTIILPTIDCQLNGFELPFLNEGFVDAGDRRPGAGRESLIMDLFRPVGPPAILTSAQKVKPNATGSCGGVFNGTKGRFASPDYPIYPSDANCSWVIEVPAGNLVKLEFEYMDIEVGPPECPFDGVLIYDYGEMRNAGGIVPRLSGPISPGVEDPQVMPTVLGNQRYCGQASFDPMFSVTNSVTIEFYSDSDSEGDGFVLNWTAVPAPKDDYNCDFEDGLCPEWENIETEEDNFDWEIVSGKTKTDNTGPVFDHSRGDIGGKYAYIEASKPRLPNDTAILSSKEIEFLQDETALCVQFWYHMYGRHVGTLAMGLAIGEDRNVQWMKSGDQGMDWHMAAVTVQKSDTPFRIMFVGVRGSGYAGDVAIDDIKIQRNPCIELPETETPFAFVNNTDVSETATTAYADLCEDEEYPCIGNSKCLAEYQVCDGVTDCPDGDDEEDFLCKDSSTVAPPLYTSDEFTTEEYDDATTDTPPEFVNETTVDTPPEFEDTTVDYPPEVTTFNGDYTTESITMTEPDWMDNLTTFALETTISNDETTQIIDMTTDDFEETTVVDETTPIETATTGEIKTTAESKFFTTTTTESTESMLKETSEPPTTESEKITTTELMTTPTEKMVKITSEPSTTEVEEMVTTEKKELTTEEEIKEMTTALEQTTADQRLVVTDTTSVAIVTPSTTNIPEAVEETTSTSPQTTRTTIPTTTQSETTIKGEHPVSTEDTEEPEMTTDKTVIVQTEKTIVATSITTEATTLSTTVELSVETEETYEKPTTSTMITSPSRNSTQSLKERIYANTRAKTEEPTTQQRALQSFTTEETHTNATNIFDNQLGGGAPAMHAQFQNVILITLISVIAQWLYY